MTKTQYQMWLAKGERNRARRARRKLFMNKHPNWSNEPRALRTSTRPSPDQEYHGMGVLGAMMTRVSATFALRRQLSIMGGSKRG